MNTYGLVQTNLSSRTYLFDSGVDRCAYLGSAPHVPVGEHHSDARVDHPLLLFFPAVVAPHGFLPNDDSTLIVGEIGKHVGVRIATLAAQSSREWGQRERVRNDNFSGRSLREVSLTTIVGRPSTASRDTVSIPGNTFDTNFPSLKRTSLPESPCTSHASRPGL